MAWYKYKVSIVKQIVYTDIITEDHELSEEELLEELIDDIDIDFANEKNVEYTDFSIDHVDVEEGEDEDF